MSALSGSMALTTSDGYVHLSRELWGEVVTALNSDDPGFQRDVAADVMRLAPASWDADLEDRAPPTRVIR